MQPLQQKQASFRTVRNDVGLQQKQQEFNKWEQLQEQSNAVYNDVSARIGVYIEFIDFLSQQPKSSLGVTSSKVHFKAEMQAPTIEIVEKFKQLKDTISKINSQIQLLDQRMKFISNKNSIYFTMQQNLPFDSTNETYYESLKQKFDSVQDLQDLSENDMLREIESKIDMNKEEEIIEAFIKKKRSQQVQIPETFSIFKLKQKVMNNKLDKIKGIIENLSVDQIRKQIEDQIKRLSLEIQTLKNVSQNGNQSVSLKQQDSRISQKGDEIERIRKKQKQLDESIDKVLQEIISMKQQQSQDDVISAITRQQEELMSLLKKSEQRYLKILQENENYKRKIEELESQSKEGEIKIQQNTELEQQLEEKSKQLEQQSSMNEYLQNEISTLNEKLNAVLETNKNMEEELQQLEQTNISLQKRVEEEVNQKVEDQQEDAEV